MRMEKQQKMIYHPPLADVTKVDTEQGIAVATSITGKTVNWEEVSTPVGDTPETDGGDFYIFY